MLTLYLRYCLDIHTSFTLFTPSQRSGPRHGRAGVGTFHGHGQDHEPSLLGLCAVRFWDPLLSFGERFTLLSVRIRFMAIAFKLAPRHGGERPLLPLIFPTLSFLFPRPSWYSVGRYS